MDSRCGICPKETVQHPAGFLVAEIRPNVFVTKIPPGYTAPTRLRSPEPMPRKVVATPAEFDAETLCKHYEDATRFMAYEHSLYLKINKIAFDTIHTYYDEDCEFHRSNFIDDLIVAADNPYMSERKIKRLVLVVVKEREKAFDIKKYRKKYYSPEQTAKGHLTQTLEMNIRIKRVNELRELGWSMDAIREWVRVKGQKLGISTYRKYVKILRETEDVAATSKRTTSEQQGGLAPQAHCRPQLERIEPNRLDSWLVRAQIGGWGNFE